MVWTLHENGYPMKIKPFTVCILQYWSENGRNFKFVIGIIDKHVKPLNLCQSHWILHPVSPDIQPSRVEYILSITFTANVNVTEVLQ